MTNDSIKYAAQYAGNFPIDDCIGEDTKKFDRRKFGKQVKCNCGRKFNPFYCKSNSEGDWSNDWVGFSHTEPTCPCRVKCPTCKSDIYYSIHIPQ